MVYRERFTYEKIMFLDIFRRAYVLENHVFRHIRKGLHIEKHVFRHIRKGFYMRNKQKILNWLSKRNSKATKQIYRFYEPIAYLFFGVLTTLVNVAIYTMLEQIFGQENWYISNLPAIFLAILFAYVTNRSFVFDSVGNFWTELYRFFSARIIISLVCEYGMAYLLFNVLKIDFKIDFGFLSVSLFKILSQGFVIVGNYFVSKIFVFKTNKTIKMK